MDDYSTQSSLQIFAESTHCHTEAMSDESHPQRTLSGLFDAWIGVQSLPVEMDIQWANLSEEAVLRKLQTLGAEQICLR